MKLMIVDDSLIIRNKIGRSLLSAFSNVYRASNGHQAVRIAVDERPDVITMDLTMPELGGVEAIRKIVKVLPNSSILVVSALADKDTAIQALADGANGFLCKPFTDQQLGDAITRVMRLRGKA